MLPLLGTRLELPLEGETGLANRSFFYRGLSVTKSRIIVITSRCLDAVLEIILSIKT